MNQAANVAVFLAGVAAPALAAPPVPDARLEVALSTNVISQFQRTVEFDKTLPQPAVRARPVVKERDMERMRDSLYVERRLMPPRPGAGERDAVRIYGTDR